MKNQKLHNKNGSLGLITQSIRKKDHKTIKPWTYAILLNLYILRIAQKTKSHKNRVQLCVVSGKRNTKETNTNDSWIKINKAIYILKSIFFYDKIAQRPFELAFPILKNKRYSKS